MKNIWTGTGNDGFSQQILKPSAILFLNISL